MENEEERDGEEELFDLDEEFFICASGGARPLVDPDG